MSLQEFHPNKWNDSKPAPPVRISSVRRMIPLCLGNYAVLKLAFSLNVDLLEMAIEREDLHIV